MPTSDYFPEGSHTLALVTKTTDARVTLQLHPDINVTLRRRDITDDPDVPIGDLHTVGDVVRVRVLINDEGRHTVTLMGVDPDAPLHPSLPLIEGASPWLREGESHAVITAPAVEDAPAPDAAPAPVPIVATTDAPTTSDVAALRHEVTELRRDILALTNLVARLGGTTAPASVDDEFAKLRAQTADFEEQLRIERAERADAEAKLAHEVELRREAVRGARGASGPIERMPMITTETALREAIQGLWDERALGSDREEWPLRDYRVGPEFIDSLCKISESARAKTLRAAVDAITGRDKEIPGRDLHRLRRGNGGDDPYVTRDDGAHAWRSAIENNTASARRLHYWALPGGGIELSRVVLHDDTMP